MLTKLFATLCITATSLVHCTCSVSAATQLDEIVAVVNNDVVMASELDRLMGRIKQELRQQGTRFPPAPVLENQVLERLVLQKIQLQMADRAGLRVDDGTLNRTISDIAAENGLGVSDFRRILQKEGYDFTQFREDIRDEILITQLRQRQVDNRVQVTEQEIENYLATMEQQGDSETEYHLAHILIAKPEHASAEQSEALQKKAAEVLRKLRQGVNFQQVARAVSNGRHAEQGGDMGWLKGDRLPTLFAELAMNMKDGDISNLIESSSGFHIMKLTETRGGQIHMITQTKARHILIKTNELLSDEDARARLTQFKLRVEGGADFADLARSNSEDHASAAKGGDLGWVSPGDLVPIFEQQMDSLAPGQTSEPFKTQFGWHIVQVQERREHDATDSVRRAKAREAIRKRKIEDERQVWLQRLRDEAYLEYRLDQK
jgi:peptidyl-prolyl cis-trans isomerase SurA